MLAKCANPNCSHVFRYFGAGKLYRITQRKQQLQGHCQPEHFWLCPDCAPTMAIVTGRHGKPVVIPRAFVSAYREAVGRVSLVPEVSPAVLMQAAEAGHEHRV